jgi:hypothetical protein
VARGVDPVMESGCQSNHNHTVAGDWLEKNSKNSKINKSKKRIEINKV